MTWVGGPRSTFGLPTFEKRDHRRVVRHSKIRSLMSALGHVWTAPSWQGLSSRAQAWSVQPCVRPVDAVHMTAGRQRQLQAVRRIVLSNRQVYQCAWNSASTVAVPESNEPPIAMAEGMPFGSSQLIMAATNTAATGRTITK
jgi:hypothetical protein